MEAITEVYESGWSGHDLLYVQSQNMEMLWQDFSHKLGDQVLIPLNTYTNQFPEVRVSFIFIKQLQSQSSYLYFSTSYFLFIYINLILQVDLKNMFPHNLLM